MDEKQKERVALSKYLLKQIEFFFSNSNLWKDFPIQREMAKTTEQWLPLSLIRALPNVQAKTQDQDLVVSSIRHSTKLIVDDSNPEQIRVRRKQPLPQFNANKDSKRTLYAGGLPVGSTPESITALFEVFGPVISVMPVCLGLGCTLSDIPFAQFPPGHEYKQVSIFI